MKTYYKNIKNNPTLKIQFELNDELDCVHLFIDEEYVDSSSFDLMDVYKAFDKKEKDFDFDDFFIVKLDSSFCHELMKLNATDELYDFFHDLYTNTKWD